MAFQCAPMSFDCQDSVARRSVAGSGIAKPFTSQLTRRRTNEPSESIEDAYWRLHRSGQHFGILPNRTTPRSSLRLLPTNRTTPNLVAEDGAIDLQDSIKRLHSAPEFELGSDFTVRVAVMYVVTLAMMMGDAYLWISLCYEGTATATNSTNTTTGDTQ